MIDNDDDKFEQFPPIEGNLSGGVVIPLIIVFVIGMAVGFAYS